jgi:myo-inositol-1(or 4)-monophosphatase
VSTSEDRDLDHLLEIAVQAAAAGSDVVRAAFGSFVDVRAKGRADWVTDIDERSEAAVRDVLTRAAPDVAFCGEETGGSWGRLGWLVDPLDGTSNFVHGFPVVGVSIGLVADDEPAVGVVALPMLDEVFTARRGGGAFRNGVPVQVSERPEDAAICATGFPFRGDKSTRLAAYLPVLSGVLETFEDVRRAGSASLDLAWTAAGVFDGYFELGLGPWDVAAGALLVREAGGVVTDWSGDATAWLRSGDIVAAPPIVHDRLLGLITSHR